MGKVPHETSYALEAAGTRLLTAQMNRQVGVYALSGASPELQATIETSKVPIAVRVYGTRLVVAEVDHVTALKCFAGQICWPPQVVEVFDISEPTAPVKVAELNFDEAELLFGIFEGENAIIRQTGGFKVLAVGGAP
jgi:hypothetical protein